MKVDQNVKIDQLISEFKLQAPATGPGRRSGERTDVERPITQWVPKPIWEKYIRGQEDSDGRLGKLLKRIICTVIADVVDEAQEKT